MNDLELCKKFAELEGVKVEHETDSTVYTVGLKVYNPITDLALNCAARDKYEVHTDYINKSASMWIRHIYNDEMIAKVDIDTSRDMPRAVIECILKSKGLI